MLGCFPEPSGSGLIEALIALRQVMMLQDGRFPFGSEDLNLEFWRDVGMLRSRGEVSRRVALF